MASDSVLFMGWNRPVRGREKAAVELFNKTLQWWGKQQSSGKIDSIEPILLTSHGGDLNGFVLVRGDRTKLSEITRSDEFLDLVTQITVVVDGFGVINGWTGEGVMKQMGRYQKAIQNVP